MAVTAPAVSQFVALFENAPQLSPLRFVELKHPRCRFYIHGIRIQTSDQGCLQLNKPGSVREIFVRRSIGTTEFSTKVRKFILQAGNAAGIPVLEASLTDLPTDETEDRG